MNEVYDMTHADEVIREVGDDVSPVLQARMGTGGNQIPIVHVVTHGMIRERIAQICADLAEWPEDDWYSVVPGLNLNVFIDMDGKRRATAFLVGDEKLENGVDIEYVGDGAVGHDRVSGCLNPGDPMTLRVYGEGGANPTLQNGGTGGTIRQGVVQSVVAIDGNKLCKNERAGVDAYNQAVTGGASKPLGHSATDTDHTPAVALNHIVRRLTATECERLQGFPDGWTRIPYRGKTAEECPDSPRYKALGNSWATNCAEWILRRIVAAFRLDMIPDNN